MMQEVLGAIAFGLIGAAVIAALILGWTWCARPISGGPE